MGHLRAEGAPNSQHGGKTSQKVTYPVEGHGDVERVPDRWVLERQAEPRADVDLAVQVRKRDRVQPGLRPDPAEQVGAVQS